MTINYTFSLKKSNVGLTVVCNKGYNYVSIFSQTSCKNEVNYFLGLILVVVTRVITETKFFLLR